MVKRIVGIVLISTLILLAISSVAETYQFDSLDYSISCSLDWIPYYKGLSNEQLTKFSLTKQDVQDVINHYGLYDTDFALQNFNDEITLIIYKDKETLSLRLKGKNEEYLKGFLSTFIPNVEASFQINVTKSDLFYTEDNVYIRYEYNSPNPIINYYTTADGYCHNFSFIFFNKKSISKEQKEITEQIMRSVIWKWK